MGGSHGHGTSWKRLGTGALLTQDADEGLGHTLPIATYLKTLFALLVLTIATVIVATFDFGSWNAVVALVVASIKAALVMSFFMHLKFEGPLIIGFALYPLFILFLLIGGTFMDEGTRAPITPVVSFSYPEPKTQPIYLDHQDGGHH